MSHVKPVTRTGLYVAEARGCVSGRKARAEKDGVVQHYRHKADFYILNLDLIIIATATRDTAAKKASRLNHTRGCLPE